MALHIDGRRVRSGRRHQTCRLRGRVVAVQMFADYINGPFARRSGITSATDQVLARRQEEGGLGAVRHEIVDARGGVGGTRCVTPGDRRRSLRWIGRRICNIQYESGRGGQCIRFSGRRVPCMDRQ